MNHPDVVIVDRDDNEVGAMNRDLGIKSGKIFRIALIFLYNKQGKLYLQKRGPNVDYPGVWDSSAGGHVDAGQTYLSAAQAELEEEIGIKNVELQDIATYYSEIPHRLGTAKRFIKVYKAVSDDKLVVNSAELAEGAWLTPKQMIELMRDHPEQFTPGFIGHYQILTKNLKNSLKV
jgi:16S rRNA (adenine1518-N6/adenine1519-N6)-dimethyltransferase